MKLELLQSGLAGTIGNSTFEKIINNKTYSYLGEFEEIISIEEFTYNFLQIINPDLNKQVQQILISTDNDIFLITLNDQLESFDGENTIYYSKKDFKEEEILTSLQDFILDPKEVIIVQLEEDSLHAVREKDEINITIKTSSINYELLISNSKKIKLFFKKNKLSMFLLFLIILIPSVSIIPLNNLVHKNFNSKIARIKIDNNKLTKEKEKIEVEVKGFSQKFNSYKKEKDLLENEQELRKFFSIKY